MWFFFQLCSLKLHYCKIVANRQASGRKPEKAFNWENDPIVHAKLLWQPCKLVQMMMAPSSMLLPYWSKIRKLKGSHSCWCPSVKITAHVVLCTYNTIRWLSSGIITICDFVLVAVANVFSWPCFFVCVARFVYVSGHILTWTDMFWILNQIVWYYI